ncbi:MAG: SDR family oxidoreductase [Bacteroidetes bacterium]|nr:SDR family oxidoreductase [Bacteroidota bacterium]
MNSKKPKGVPAQHQDVQPGHEAAMTPEPIYIRRSYVGSGKLMGRTAIITGGDSGIGRAVAVHFAKEGCDVAIAYLSEHKDARETQRLVQDCGRRCLLIEGDLTDLAFCRKVVSRTLKEFGRIDVLVNNAGEQRYQEDFEKITHRQLTKTFDTNIIAMITLTQQVLPHLPAGGAIVNTTSVTAYRGSDHIIDYAVSKGAILAFTRSLSANLVDKKIRVNGVAPGPIWTPFIPSTFPPEEVKKFGKDQPMKRPGQPSEVAPCYVFLACEDSSYMTGQVLHPNGGEIVGG